MQPIDNPKEFYSKHKQLAEKWGIAPGWGKPWGDVQPMFWQFTSAGSVPGMNIDVNAFRGTMVDLRSLATSPLPEPDVEPDDEPDEKSDNSKRPQSANGLMENVRKVKKYGLDLLERHPKYWC